MDRRQSRFDIQVMRGVAVLAVVLFHAFPAALPHGFLGVDVFFVVSGFLITGIILKGVGNPGFFSGFYKRRALRLLPASLVTLTVTTALAFAFLTRSQLGDYSKQLLGSLAFVANFVIGWQTGYFEGAAETKPLLHIWSLSLEEQFYFVAPFLLWLAPSRTRFLLLGAAFVLSLTLCLVLVTGPAWLPMASKTAGKIAFFMLPSRAWELLAGSLCAEVMLRRPDLSIAPWAKYIALAAIPLVCVIGFDPVHPRLDAILVVAATCVLLLGKDGWLPDAAMTRSIWHVGNWSYSLYLVHWPLFSFAFIAYGEPPPWWVLAGLAALALFLAWAQWKYIEQPCRNGLPFRLNTSVVFCSAIAALAAIAIPATGASSSIGDQLRPAEGLGPGCDVKGAIWIDKPSCRTSDAPTVAVWGDSYAMHLIPGLDGVPLVQMTKSACSPAEGVAHVSTGYTAGWARECVSFNESVLRAIETSPSIRYVVISSPFGQILVDGGQSLLVDGQVLPFSNAGRLGFERALLRLRAAGKTPIIVGPTPRSSFDAGRCNERILEKRIVLGRVGCDIAETDAIRNGAGVDSLVKQIGKASGIDVLMPASILCAKGRCMTARKGTIIYRDTGHLTVEGSRLVLEKLGLRSRLLPQTISRTKTVH